MGSASKPPSTQPNIADPEVQEFIAKRDRSFVLDDVTPAATVPIIKTAIGQFGTVLSVNIVSDPLALKYAAKRIIVEMASKDEASHAVKEISDRPFMIKGVPRPVTAAMATSTMFPERPRKARQNAKLFRWVKKGDPDWDKYNEQKELVKTHAAEIDCLMEEIQKKEEILARDHEEKVKENLKKLDDIQSCISEKIKQRLSQYYGVKYEGAD